MRGRDDDRRRRVLDMAIARPRVSGATCGPGRLKSPWPVAASGRIRWLEVLLVRCAEKEGSVFCTSRTNPENPAISSLRKAR